MAMPDPALWQRLSPLLDDMLELPPSLQAVRLAQIRAEDPYLASELEALLREGRTAGMQDFLGGTADTEPTQALIGKRIGAYIIEALLGEGGTGTVWRATRADGRFEGAVAIKLLHLAMLGRIGASRFEREGGILARLSHPNIARLLDAGVTAEGQPYLVIELVDGTPIDRHCDERKLNVDERLALMRQVLAGVAHAHSHLVVHRDIKPNNILVDRDGTVKLLDFGIAKLLEGDLANAAATVDQQRALTPRYAAPEQLQGGAVTTATDLYALGVLMFHLLVGRHPTAPPTGGAAEVIRSTLDAEPMHLASALDSASSPDTPEVPLTELANRRSTSLAKLQRELTGDLENIVALALRKDPAARYATAAAFADDLRRYQANEPVSARPESAIYLIQKFAVRHRGKVLGALLSFIGIAAGITGTVVQSHRAERQAFFAEQERDSAVRQLRYAKTTKEFLTFLLQESSDHPLTTSELLERARPMLEGQFVGDPAARARLLGEMAALYADGTNLKRARPLIVEAEAIASRGADLHLLSSLQCLHGFLYGVDGAFSDAARSFDAAIARLRGDPIGDRATLAECLQQRAEVATLQGNGKEALQLALAAVAALGPPQAEDRVLAVILHQTLAIAQGGQGHGAQAVLEYQQAVAEMRAMGRGNTRQTSILLQNYGVVLSRGGQILQALQAVKEALAISTGLGGANASLEGNYGTLLLELGHEEEAVTALERAIDLARQSGDARSAATLLPNAARAQCAAGRLPACEESIRRARTELVPMVAKGSPVFAEVEIAQARLNVARNDMEKARDDLLRALKTLDDGHVTGRTLVVALVDLANVERQLGDWTQATVHADRAVAAAQAMLSGFQHSLWLGKALRARGVVQLGLGDVSDARRAWESALIEFVATIGDSAPSTLEVKRLIAAL